MPVVGGIAAGRAFRGRAVAAMIGSPPGTCDLRVAMSIGIDELLHACGIDCRFAKDGIYDSANNRAILTTASASETPPLPLQIAR